MPDCHFPLKPWQVTAGLAWCRQRINAFWLGPASHTVNCATLVQNLPNLCNIYGCMCLYSFNGNSSIIDRGPSARTPHLLSRRGSEGRLRNSEGVYALLPSSALGRARVVATTAIVLRVPTPR
jgi:hypothetical protein